MNATGRNSRMLGLAVGERMALVAEVASAGGRATVERVGEFAYPQGSSLAQPEALGAALGQYLKQQGFTARSVVVGIPGKWVLTKRLEAPPAEPALVAETLRLQAEGEFAADGGDFAFDYAGEASASEPRPVLLMAVPRRQVDQVTAVATAARLRAAAVVPFAATLGAAAARTSKDARVLLFGPGGAEFVAQDNGHPNVMRYLGPSTSPPAFLAGELRRASAGAPAGGAASSGGVSRGAGAIAAPSANGTPHGGLLVWNDARVEAGSLTAFGDTLGMPLTLGDPRALGLAAAPNGIDASAGYAAAVSLAMAGLEVGRDGMRPLPVDFLHSRLAPPRQVRVRRRTLVLAAAGVAALALVGAAVLDLGAQQSAVNALKAELKAGEEGVKAAATSMKKTEYAQPWHATDPVFVACLHDLTAAMPEDGQTFLTRFSLNDELKGEFAGSSSNGEQVLALLDRLKESGRFADVKPTSYDTPRPAVKPGPRGPGGAPGAGPGAPPGGPPGGPPMPGGPGAPPGAMPPGMPGGPMPPGMPAAPQGGPAGMDPAAAMAMAQAGGQAQAMAQAQAQAMAQARGMQGQPPPQPPMRVPSPGAGGGPPQPPPPSPADQPPAPGVAGGGEVTFSMTFNYVPRE